LKVSVITITGRELFIEYQIEYLKAQTLKDFEWVLVDDLYEKRKEEVARLVDGDFLLTHIPPKNIVEHFAVGAAANDGFVRARGELVYFMADYILINGNTLQRHWDIHIKYPNAIISGRCLEVNFLPEEMALSGATFRGTDYRWSLFDSNLFMKRKIEDDIWEAYRDGVQNWWGGRNDSAPLEAILAVNGYDEQYDGCYGYHDDDAAQRMMTYGMRYLLDKQSLALQFPHKKSGKLRLRSMESQQLLKDNLIPEKVGKGIYWANPHRNLKEERCRKP